MLLVFAKRCQLKCFHPGGAVSINYPCGTNHNSGEIPVGFSTNLSSFEMGLKGGKRYMMQFLQNLCVLTPCRVLKLEFVHFPLQTPSENLPLITPASLDLCLSVWPWVCSEKPALKLIAKYKHTHTCLISFSLQVDCLLFNLQRSWGFFFHIMYPYFPLKYLKEFLHASELIVRDLSIACYYWDNETCFPWGLLALLCLMHLVI